MRGTLVLLCILLFIWIGGSSYLHVKRINGQNSKEQIIPEDQIQAEGTVTVDKPEIDVAATEIESEPFDKTSETLDSLKLATKYILENPSRTIYFKYARYEAELSTEDVEYMNKLRLFLENEPARIIYVIGHSDASGTPEGQVFASDQRVKFIKEAMLESGIPEKQIQTKSLGEGYPAESNSTIEGRAKNRRVEITFTNFKFDG